MKSKRLKALLLACTVVASTSFTACGKSDTGKATGSQQNSAEEARIKNVNKTGTKIVNDSITIRVAMPRPALSKTDAQNKQVAKDLESKTNIKVEWIEMPEASMVEKTNIMLASGDLPDVFLTVINEAQMLNNYKNKVFTPLNNLIDEWAPNIKKAFEQYPDVKRYLTLEDGNIYGTPGGELAPWLDFRATLFINKTWIDKLGLKMPETTEEYYQVLKAFKEKDPNGNGKNDEIPLSLANENQQINNILAYAGSFGIPMNFGFNKPVEYITIKDKKAVFAPATENFKEFLLYFNKLSKEGLLDKESFSQSIDQFRAKGKNETMLLGSFNQFLEDVNVGDNRIKDYAAIKPLKGPNGDQIAYKEILAPVFSGVITKNNKNPEATMRWLDYMNGDTYTKLELWYGLESEGVWSKVDGGKWITNTDKAPNGTTFNEWRFTTALTMAPPLYSDEIKNTRVIDPRPARKLQFVDMYQPYANKDDLPRMILPLELQQQINVIQPDLKKLVDNFIAQSVLNGIDDNSWKTFLSNLEKAKYKEYEALYQKVYDLKK